VGEEFGVSFVAFFEESHFLFAVAISNELYSKVAVLPWVIGVTWVMPCYGG